MDEALLLLINGHHTDYWDVVMTVATHRFAWIPMYLALAYAVFRTEGWRAGCLTLAAVGLTVLLADQIGAGLIRPLAERLRPSSPDNPLSQYIHIVNGYRGGRYGMPSCHAANTFGLFTLLALRYRRGPLIYIIGAWAAVQVYTRMYLGVHYPTDILAGAALGAVCALVAYGVWREAYRRIQGSAPQRVMLCHTGPFYVTVALLAAVMLCGAMLIPSLW